MGGAQRSCTCVVRRGNMDKWGTWSIESGCGLAGAMIWKRVVFRGARVWVLALAVDGKLRYACVMTVWGPWTVAMTKLRGGGGGDVPAWWRRPLVAVTDAVARSCGCCSGVTGSGVYSRWLGGSATKGLLRKSHVRGGKTCCLSRENGNVLGASVARVTHDGWVAKGCRGDVMRRRAWC